ncbi:MAG TPA: S26 family signal peptidase [Rectinemataceae bacterium]|nr:S26 family signal peptidase [Rectinemataceae bacterium]
MRSEARKRSGSASVGLILVCVIAMLILGRTFVVDAALVHGRSMLPSFGSGDIVIVFKAAYGLRTPHGGYFFLWGEPEPRDVVAAFNPDTKKVIIKRVWMEEGVDRPGREGSSAAYFLLGDNKYESIDSREFGPVPMNNILGKVLSFPLF